MAFKDVLIVGFGISGSTVAHRLKLAGLNFDVISDRSQTATRVAGGVINPLVLKRYKTAWRAQEFYTEAIKFYQRIETLLDCSLLQQPKLYKQLKTPEECNDFATASNQVYLSNFLSERLEEPSRVVHDKVLKVGPVNQIYTINLKTYLESSISYFNSSFKASTFIHNELKITSEGFGYNSTIYKNIVFCEGYGIINNPFFNHLPIYGNKGEYLIIKSTELQSNHASYKARHFLIPLGNDLYKFGANYQRDKLSNLPTDKIRQELAHSFEQMFSVNYEIIDQVAGIRPTVKDRKPILGEHPSHQHMYLYNGNGSRGVLAAPQLSKNLVELMFKGNALNPEIDLKRFI